MNNKLPGQDLNLEREDQNLLCYQLHHRVRFQFLLFFIDLEELSNFQKFLQKCFFQTTRPGLEPGTRGPKPLVLPITPPG